MATLPEALAAAIAHHRAGRLPQAEQICRQILAVDPQHPEALNLLGVLALQARQHEAAVDLLGRAVVLRPQVAKFHNDLAAAYLSVGRLDEAVAGCRRSLEIDAAYAEAHFNLAVILRAQGHVDEALQSCKRALAIRPDYVEAHNNLGILLQGQGRLDEALACYQRALEIRPGYVRAHGNLACALIELGRLPEAVAACDRALQINPRYVEAHFHRGNALAAARKLPEAIACYQQALALRPNHVRACNRLGCALRGLGHFDEALAAHRQATEVAPDDVEAHHNLAILHEERGQIDEAAADYRRIQEIQPEEPLWELRLATLCPNVFQSADEIDEYRDRLLADIERFAERELRVEPSKLAILGTGPPYDLQFHGRNDRPIKESFAAIFRHWDPGEAPGGREGRYRIGFVVGDAHEAIFLRCLGGVLENLDADLFEPVVVCSPAGAAVLRSMIESDAVDVLAVPDRVDAAAQAIRAGGFDLLYYWEVGSGTANYFLPFFRLAPVQCTGWGLPVTSGIPQMDCFLSSRLVEPADADGRYGERLVRAGTLLTYQRRPSLPDAPKGREDFGLGDEQHVYACLQQVQKFHPDFDPILAEILRADGSGVIVVPRDQHEANTAALESRFAEAMPDVADRIVWMPQQPYPDYLSLVAAADVLLDPLHFGGGLTTYDAFSVGRPIVTLPGEFRRGRFTLACYGKMGIAECVASDAEDYVRIAVDLATDRDYRESIEEDLREAGPSLFEEMEAVREYERIFQVLIEEARAR